MRESPLAKLVRLSALRYVRTQAGMDKYGEPINTPILINAKKLASKIGSVSADGTEKKATQFFTGQTNSLNFETAVKELDSAQHKSFVQKAKEINAKYKARTIETRDFVGDTSQYGTEDSIMQRIEADAATSRLIAAEKGLAGNQLSVLNFVRDDNGSDYLISVPMPATLGLEELRGILDKRGLEFRSIDPKTNELMFFSGGGDKLAEIKQLAEDYSDGRVGLSRGTGEFVGSDDSREAAAAVYRGILEGAQGLGANGQGRSDSNNGTPSVNEQGEERQAPETITPQGMHAVADDDLAARAAFREKVGRAIPKAWTSLFIADDLDNSRKLVVGRDAAGRLTSIYSAAHTEEAAADKFERLQEVSKVMPRLDKVLKRDLMGNDEVGVPPLNDTIAAVLLMRKLGVRVGSTKDTKSKVKAYGTTTLEARHMKIEDGKVVLDFTGKKGVAIHLESKDKMLVSVMTRALEGKEPNDRLFNTTPEKTISYIREQTGNSEFKNHDLRTYLANVIAVATIRKHKNETPLNKVQYNQWRTEVGEAVAAQLGNNKTEALASYINPVVFSEWDTDGTMVLAA